MAVDFMIEINQNLKDYFENWKEYAEVIKEKSEEILKDKNLRVYVFGSIVKGQYHSYLSDIDVAVVSEKLPKEASTRGKILGELSKSLGMGNPFEIHLLSPELWKLWYLKFIDKFVEF